MSDEKRTTRTLFEVLGMDEQAIQEFRDNMAERLRAIEENERQAHIATKDVWLR